MVGMGDVRIKMERGLKMSFSLEVVFLYLSYLNILFVFGFLFLCKGFWYWYIKEVSIFRGIEVRLCDDLDR